MSAKFKGAGLGDAVGRHPWLAGGAFVYLAVATIYGMLVGARLTASYVAVVGVGILAMAVADSRVRFSRLVLIGIWLWGLTHLAGGLVSLDDHRVLYNAVVGRWIHYDNVVHAMGFGSAGIAAWEATRPWLPALDGHRLGVAVVVWLWGMGVGALNEVVEFGISHAVAETSIGGYENTGRDLVANMVGALLAGWLVSRRAGSDLRHRSFGGIPKAGRIPSR